TTKRQLLLLTFVSVFQTLPAQDTLPKVLHDEVTVVTATRSERMLYNCIVPVSMVNQKQLQQSGSLRLNEILQEQTGIFITGGTGRNAVGGGVFGNGLQLQGLSPDHTLVLVDGEPVIGRQGGTLDLSRFTTGNIKKIEVIKGPSSSLYGSEAMGGVVNIITEPVKGKNIGAHIRYGSFRNTDIAAHAGWDNDKTGVYVFANRNGNNGYDLDKTTVERTADPWHSYTGQLKLHHRLGSGTKLLLNTRAYYAEQQSEYAVNSSKINVQGNGVTEEVFVNPTIDHRFSKRFTSSLRLSGSFYKYAQQLDSVSNKASYYADRFAQHLLRAENLSEFRFSEDEIVTAGAGITHIQVNTNRYAGIKTQLAQHIFAQYEWNRNRVWQVIAGLRYDHYTAFTPALSPKLAIKLQPAPQWVFRASAGRGFKAPDFRQLYLNFVNNAADGYTLYGASAFSIQELEQQLASGLLARILPDAARITELKPESSVGYNFAADYTPVKGIQVSVSAFRNDVQNLVNYIPVAQKPNGSNVFSYINLNRAVTQGAAAEITVKQIPGVTIQGGYQYLFTADKDIYNAIKEGTVYGRDYIGGPARLMTRKDYGGLNNRSKHSANIKLFYEPARQKWNASLRAVYRSRWGVYDNDGNGFANQQSEFARGCVLLNAAVTVKPLANWQVQTGINNLLNYTDGANMPNQPGINGFISLVYSFKK
ncbi:MAG: TonB-dependent receptor, partial [Dinghuibacter sp.]|nr:TonB-dependent receptor [Dinghuibacter sp.]